MRRYVPDYSDVGISRDRYRELLYYCRQYPEMVATANDKLYLSAQQYKQTRHADGVVSDPTLRAVISREAIKARMKVIEDAAMEAAPEWYSVLITNVCYAQPLSSINPAILPTSHLHDYYPVKKRFFVCLDARLMGIYTLQ